MQIYLENLLGTERYRNPCNFVDMLMTSQNLFQNVGKTGSGSVGTQMVRSDFTSFFGVPSSGLEESTRKESNIVNILDDGSDGDKLALVEFFCLL
ncbi:unnamed protein product, partial [Thlaspi arvense]